MKDDFYSLYCEAVEENERLKKENKSLKIQVVSLTRRVRYLEDNQDQIIESKVNKAVDKITAAFEDKVFSLEKQVCSLKSILNNDGTNSGIPTSKTPIQKQKRIPNSRVPSDKKKGGQPNHKKHKLERFDDSEITDTVDHAVDVCPECGAVMEHRGNMRTKDELDFQIIVKKIRHRFINSFCPACGYESKAEIPNHLKEENQYGRGVQATALSLLNEGCVSMKRTQEFITGISHGEIETSAGYIAKLQKRLYEQLERFDEELKKEIIKLDIVHWDDTVIMINKNRGCLRFYGNDKLAYYASHEKKDKAGLDEDRILNSLDAEKKVVHDHNIVNYNEEYEFMNVECCVHLLRDLKKVVDNLGHEWPKKMINLLLEENTKRNEGEAVFPEYVGMIYDECVIEGIMENDSDEDKFYAKEEKALLKRLEKYKENYLMWTYNEDIPFSNNVSERSLRSTKTKMKVSGQFQNIQNARYYARIKSYIETGKRHGINSIKLIEEALKGEYITIGQMKEHDNLY